MLSVNMLQEWGGGGNNTTEEEEMFKLKNNSGTRTNEHKLDLFQPIYILAGNVEAVF